jgi:hypothetical protein
MGEVFARDIIQMSSDFDNRFVGSGGGVWGVSQEGTKDVWTTGEVAGAESVPDFFRGKVF